jgi:hypothetical protein
MSRPSLSLAVLLGVAALLLPSRLCLAERLDATHAPEPLRPWTGWVLEGHDDALCPAFQGMPELIRCVWPTRLSLSLTEKGGRFEQRWYLDRRAWIPLPGDETHWPLDVKSGAAKVVVVPHDGVPSVELPPGDHTLSGSFAWDSLPDALAVPRETGILQLTVNGAAIGVPRRDDTGRVFLQKKEVESEGERLDLVVHRRVTDDVPLLLTTRIVLDVSGKSREVALGKSLPAGFVPMSITSELPARIEPDTRLRVQVRPGTWTIELTARSEGLPAKLERPQPDGPWREGEEVWVFEAKPSLRLVSVEGARAVDPQQTSLPDSWKTLPAYAMALGDEMRLAEKRRGDVDPEPDRLALERTLWLDFDGHGYTANDTITGTLHRASRLEMLPLTQSSASRLVLGRVAIDGKDQFITTLDPSATPGHAPKEAGVEVRQGDLHVSADSRIEGGAQDIPAVGYDHDFNQVSATLHLPPGFRLFHASGADEVPGTWIRNWTLLELFLVTVLALSFAKLFGRGWGAVACLTFVLVFPETDAAKWLWPIALAAEALARVVPAGKVRGFVSAVRAAVLVLLLLATLPFIVQHVREGIYPALADGETSSGAGGLLQDFEAAKSVEAPTMAGAAAPPPMEPAASPAPQQQTQAMDEDRAKDAPDSLARGKKGGSGSSSSNAAYRQFNAEVYDPSAMVQTGPGLPKWQWSTTTVRFSGPVERSQRLHLYLLPPGTNLVLALVRAALLALLFLRLLPYRGTPLPGPRPAALGFAALLLCLFSSQAARADVPSPELLDQLRERLLAKPDCAPTCASSSRLLLEARGSILRARMAVEASETTAVPLPGGAAQWSPQRVALDGKDATGLLRTTDGVLWLRVSAGAHDVSLEGTLPSRESVQIALPMKPHRVEAIVEGFLLEGLHEDGLADDHLQLTRTHTEEGSSGGALAAGTLPAFVRVERTLLVGLSWQVSTRVVRITPPGVAVVLEVPLLKGESVTTPNVRVVQGKALVNMAPEAAEVSWRSALDERSPIVLAAPKTVAWSETWRLDSSPIWHATLSGIPVVHGEAGSRVPEWRPWPGETATIDLMRPAGIPGRTLTIDSTDYEVRPGLRTTDATASFSVRSSRGGEHVVRLPEGAELESVSVNGASQPLRQQGRTVPLSITPGSQSVQLTFRLASGIATRFTVPELDLGTSTVNATTRVRLSDARWVLWVHGPRLGPAVLFWSLLLVLVAVAYALGAIAWVPLKRWEWMLLAIGLSQVPLPAAAIVVGWLFALGWRGQHPDGSPLAFDLRQLILIGWTFAALGILIFAVQQGLMGTPDMQIRGNSSSAELLQWFDDRTAAVPERPFVVSVPMLVYRGAMLAWALWLAVSLLSWLRFGWISFSTGGLWKKRERRIPTPLMPIPAAPAPAQVSLQDPPAGGDAPP